TSSNTNAFGNFFSNLTGGISNIGGSLFGQVSNLFGSIGSATSGGLTTGNNAPGSTIAGNLNSALDGAVAGSNGANGSTGATGSGERRVRISPKPSQRGMLSGVLEPLKTTGGLVFPYTPQITYQGRATYNPLKTVHANQDWHIYQNTDS